MTDQETRVELERLVRQVHQERARARIIGGERQAPVPLATAEALAEAEHAVDIGETLLLGPALATLQAALGVTPTEPLREEHPVQLEAEQADAPRRVEE